MTTHLLQFPGEEGGGGSGEGGEPGGEEGEVVKFLISIFWNDHIILILIFAWQEMFNWDSDSEYGDMQSFPDLSARHKGGAIKAPKGHGPSKLSKGQLLNSRESTLSVKVMLCTDELKLSMDC